MNKFQYAHRFWQAIAAQEREALRAFFCPDGRIRWHCTNEEFSVEEFLCANCDYPGQWEGSVERILPTEDGMVTVAQVRDVETGSTFHAVSFFQMEGERIRLLEEYWADDGPPPSWRQALKLGRPIK
ncbi:MAG: nuclear transport factor 2 family protein [Oscillospiraceae bacterium]|nr:nuclear transport factor 2 family protein [Oscillospiraceae bacterium]MBQ8732604.1 nuclear transport factor 2 family protein [Oscillospiraceae bacterium]